MGRLKTILLLLLAMPTFGVGPVPARLNIRTTDASVSNYPYQLKVSPGTLTDNGDGTMTLTTGSGSGSNQAVAFLDALSNRWIMTIDTAGHLVTTADSSTSATRYNHLVLKDIGGSYWEITVGILGNLITTNGGSFPQSIDHLTISDSNGIGWLVTVEISGNLETN